MSIRITRGLPGRALGVGPDEALVAHPEVEAVAVDLLHVRQRERQPAYVVGVSHGWTAGRRSAYGMTGPIGRTRRRQP